MLSDWLSTLSEPRKRVFLFLGISTSHQRGSENQDFGSRTGLVEAACDVVK